MKRFIASILIVIILIGLIPTFSYAKKFGADDYIAFAKSQMGKTGKDYKQEYGIYFEWCAWFTTLCAKNNNMCGTPQSPESSVFPPFESSTWGENNWAATGVTYQVNWFTEHNKGVIYKFSPDSRIRSNNNVVETTASQIVPMPGDLIYFDWIKEKAQKSWDHVAIVECYDKDTDVVTYIGGNQGESEDKYEREVSEKQKLRTDTEIAGIMHVDYSNADSFEQPECTPLKAYYCITSETGVNMRWLYGTEYTKIGRIPYSAEIPVFEKTVAEANGHIWARTEYNGKSGWFAFDYSAYCAPAYDVIFCDSDGSLLKYEMIKEGSPADAPKTPVHNGYLFVGWDRDFSAVTFNMTVTATYSENTLKGDANADGTVNTFDAVWVLKYSVHMVDENSIDTLLGDMNSDGNVNTGDAFMLLKKIAGIG